VIYISKLRVVRDLFARYENAIVRWPHIKLHSFVVFDPKVGFQNSMFELLRSASATVTRRRRSSEAVS
jgi:hypothetical protein